MEILQILGLLWTSYQILLPTAVFILIIKNYKLTQKLYKYEQEEKGNKRGCTCSK